MSCRGNLRRVRVKVRRVEANYDVSGPNYVVSRQITSCQGQITSFQGKFVVSRQITSCRGKLRRVRVKVRRVEANYDVSGPHYVVSREITSCGGNLRNVGENYGVSVQITQRLVNIMACQGKLRYVEAYSDMPGQIRVCQGKLLRAWANSVVPRRIRDRVPKNIMYSALAYCIRRWRWWRRYVTM